jgi:hypothetical protein
MDGYVRRQSVTDTGLAKEIGESGFAGVPVARPLRVGSSVRVLLSGTAPARERLA